VRAEPGKQKLRRCRVQELARSRCQENGAEKGHLLKSVTIEDEAQTRGKQWRGLVETQRHDGVDARGAARGDVTGCEGDKRQHKGHG
jgi:hypothetical protein